MLYPADPSGRRPSEITMLQYAGPQERAYSHSNGDVYRIENSSHPFQALSAPETEDEQQVLTATAPANYGHYLGPYNWTALSQNSQGPLEAQSSSTATLQSRYGQIEAQSISTTASQISYTPYEAEPNWAPISEVSNSRNEEVQSSLHQPTVSGGDIDRPADNRTQSTWRARPRTDHTRQWYCCTCGSGPYIPSLYGACVMNCGHVKCFQCGLEYVQVHDYGVSRAASP